MLPPDDDASGAGKEIGPAPGAAAPGHDDAGDECRGRVRSALSVVEGGDLGDAERRLLGLTADCPGSGLAFRELAALRFRQERWAEAADAARTATRLAPGDEHARRLLAASTYLEGDPLGALETTGAGRTTGHRGGSSSRSPTPWASPGSSISRP